MTEKVKVLNYTPEMEEVLREKYTASPTSETVDALAEELGKARRSVISKLSTMGIYQKPEKVTKAGKPVVKKDELVARIAYAVGVQGLASLSKANKLDLEALVAAVEVMADQIAVNVEG